MNLLKTLARVSSLTLLSRILGFVRDTLIARQFGAGPATDAFFVAFKLPNLLRRLFSEGAFAQAFVPMLSEHRHHRSHAETRAFIASISAMLGLALTLLSALGMLAAPLLVWLMAPGFSRSGPQFALTVDLLRITLPYILLISLSSLAGSILNAWGRFAIPAFTPAILNLTFIVVTLTVARHVDPPVAALAWATFFGGCLQLLYPLYALRRLDLLPRPRLNLQDRAAWRVMLRMLPAIFSVSVAQISLLLNSTFASFLPSGSVSWMYYADRLMEFPTGVLGAALGTILLPSLSRHAADADHAAYSALLDWGIRLTLLLALPATLGLAMLAGPLTNTLFHYGQFTLHDAAMTRQALIAYAIGLVGLILIKVLAPGFFARQNLRTPVRIALWTLAATLLLNLLLIVPLRHAGLALSIGLASLLNAGLLLYELWRSRIYRPAAGWPRYLAQLAGALAVMALLLHGLQQGLPAGWDQQAHGRMAGLALLIGLGAIGYFLTLLALGLRPRDLKHQ
ncbi:MULTISPECIES: murein biosynthesis integral membrane protein MurJ [unclassified Paludibacterium]|uniref:murein biosynthesis integral membrane protein MurJ n=1 Tax=unclassified Paludibacterium TaxID=2618429 RepID=UPI001C056390|nr:murein biosynthesis integral membrane protein MurJ [Paludibacterium sp. B53371]BEV73445.1 murein biosynthesis integral membrane protein MurJ [Paludibacterium sp. THUN1379]